MRTLTLSGVAGVLVAVLRSLRLAMQLAPGDRDGSILQVHGARG